MHDLEKKARNAGDAYIAAKKAYEAARVDAAGVGFKVSIQSGSDGEFVTVSGGPEPDIDLVEPAALLATRPAVVVIKPETLRP